MKNISLYITEKLHIDKEVKTTKPDLSNVRAPWFGPSQLDYDKMKAYRNKGSKPERLVATIKDKEKLGRRFAAAVDLLWDDAINVFGKALVDRGLYKQEQIDKYIEVHKK